MTRAPVPPEKVPEYAARVERYRREYAEEYARGGMPLVRKYADRIREQIRKRIANDMPSPSQHLVEHWYDLLAIYTAPDEGDECPT